MRLVLSCTVCSLLKSMSLKSRQQCRQLSATGEVAEQSLIGLHLVDGIHQEDTWFFAEIARALMMTATSMLADAQQPCAVAGCCAECMLLGVLLCRREREMQRKEAEEARTRKKQAFLR